MRVFVVGGRGKLGASLVEGLRLKGYDVVCLYRDLGKLYEAKEEDVVVNAAGRVFGSCKELEESNFFLVKRIFDIVRRRGSFFIHISSIAVYGYRDYDGIVEEKAEDCYGKSKLMADNFLYGKAAILRLGPVFGGRFKSYANFLNILKRGIFPYFDRLNIHIPFTYAKDVVDLVSYFVEKRKPFLEIFAGPGEMLANIYDFVSEYFNVKPIYLKLPRELSLKISSLFGFQEYVKVLSFSRRIPLSGRIKPTPFKEAFLETIKEYKMRGWIR